MIQITLASLALSSLVAGLPQAKAAFACNKNALTAEERAMLPKIFVELTKASPIVKELPNGFELSFSKSKGLFEKAAKWTTDESRCCPFFDFSLTVARYGGPMVIRITGPVGVKAFIAEDLPRLHRLLQSSSDSAR